MLLIATLPGDEGSALARPLSGGAEAMPTATIPLSISRLSILPFPLNRSRLSMLPKLCRGSGRVDNLKSQKLPDRAPRALRMSRQGAGGVEQHKIFGHPDDGAAMVVSLSRP